MIDTGPGLTMEIVFAESFLTKYVDLFTSLPRNARNSLLHGKTEGQRETESESMAVQLSVRVCKLLCLCHKKAPRKEGPFSQLDREAFLRPPPSGRVNKQECWWCNL